MSEKISNPVASQFNQIADHYDGHRRKLIPCFDDFYRIAASLVQADTDSPRILDLGAGTGLFSDFVLRQYPKAKLTLIDLSEGMLDVAKQRFGGEHSNITYLAGDYSEFDDPEPYDAIISSLSIHHLEHETKRALYHRLFKLLKPNGVLVNADQVQGSSPFIDNLYRSDWHRKVKATDLSREALQAAYERTKLDKMAPLDKQLNWLLEGGFVDVDCVYKYYNFVVIHARKP
ncbi:trans-aconitate 2-methyltransferase [Paenibacillus sp. N3.4]|uniref:class I SAM-dependent methyltransferase n=1 Tax=Paenibacillus sp. N3.4 TaxID=2603222 RepID=UPI0011C88F8C|nr:class I SAM-dependent methyltransferase [Paenibacillus sp. N3.4]TXK70049.1 class I SAM-dependent methyltransferase [Paenibacillus sp. N3.4]